MTAVELLNESLATLKQAVIEVERQRIEIEYLKARLIDLEPSQ